jgi:hypothetical protein
MPAPDVLDERMPDHDHPGAAVLLEPSHRTQPRLQLAMVTLDPVVGVLVAAMPRCRQEFLKRDRVGRRPIGDHLDRLQLRRADGPLEEPARASASRLAETNTSMIWPNWSIAR